jgi:hypothetical protein
MKKFSFLIALLAPVFCHADTIGHYMEIAENLPRMEIKADEQAQAWARSARNVLLLTGESIWESLRASNEVNAQNGNPLFCAPPNTQMTAESMVEMIESTYASLSMGEAEKNSLTVAQIGLIGLQKKYPCQKTANKPRTSSQPTITIQSKGPSPLGKMLHVGSLAAGL